jgi:membrane-bound metal-dependent hydrolase YbcI (DUF457 family)
MASIVGHMLGGVLVYQGLERLGDGHVPQGVKGMAVAAGLSIIPDFDTLINMAFNPYGTHRGISHSAIAALIFASAAALLFGSRRGWGFLSAMSIFFVVCLVHPLLDYLMAGGPRVPFWAPFSTKGYLSPVQLIPTAYYSQTPTGLIHILFMPGTWLGIFLETMLFLPLILLLRIRRKSIPWIKKFVLLQGLLVALPIVSLNLIYFIYN